MSGLRTVLRAVDAIVRCVREVWSASLLHGMAATTAAQVRRLRSVARPRASTRLHEFGHWLAAMASTPKWLKRLRKRKARELAAKLELMKLQHEFARYEQQVAADRQRWAIPFKVTSA